MDENSTDIFHTDTTFQTTSAVSVYSSSNDVSVGASNEYSLTLTRFIVQRLLVPIITTFGFVGNVISICVFSQRSMASSTNCYLTALAAFDTFYLVFSFTLSLRHYDGVMDSHAYIYWFPWGRVFTDICSNVSVCLTVTFTMERYIGVCHPMKGRVLCTPKRAKLITVIVICIATGCTAPEFFEWKVITLAKNNMSYPDIQPTNLSLSFSYQVGYHWFVVAFFTILPLLLLCLFNGILIKSVLHATRIRQRLAYMSVNKEPGKYQGEQHKITLMLISLAVVFLVCQFPGAILLLYKSYLHGQEIQYSKEKGNEMRIGGNVVNLLVLINASINCILYSVMSTRFRRVFLRLFCRCFPWRNTMYRFFRADLSYLQSASARTQASSFHYTMKRTINNSFNNGYLRRETLRSAYTLPSVPGPTVRGSYVTKNTYVNAQKKNGKVESPCSVDVLPSNSPCRDVMWKSHFHSVYSVKNENFSPSKRLCSSDSDHSMTSESKWEDGVYVRDENEAVSIPLFDSQSRFGAGENVLKERCDTPL